MAKTNRNVGVQGVREDVLPRCLQMSLHKKPEVAGKLRNYALRKRATNYTQAIELLINEADYLHLRLQELKGK